MTKAVFVFRTKTEVFEFADELRSRGIPAGTVGTPKEARIGCGLAVSTEARFLSVAKKIAIGGYGGFYGIFIVERYDAKTKTTRVY